MKNVLLVLLAVLTVGAYADTYEDSSSYVYEAKDKTLADTYSQMITNLSSGFDDVCGDTFCEGDYGNLASIGLICSVTVATGQIKSCLWTFAGSGELVDGATGEITKDAKTFQCAFAPNMTLQEMIQTVNKSAFSFTETQVPGLDGSFYDVLDNCL